LDRSVLEKLHGGAMGIFSRAQRYEQTFRLRSESGAGRGFLGFLFWLWGSIGLLFNASALFGPTGSIGVGTSAYLTATSMIWIGGMVLFGMGALLGERPIPPDAGDVRVTQ
jgi:hypothetical protein